MGFVRVLVFLIGAATVVRLMLSVVRTVVVPRAQPVLLARLLFVNTRRVFDLRARLAKSYEDRDRVMALYAPLTLVLLPGVWLIVVIFGFTLMFWATQQGMGWDWSSWELALRESGSAVTTLGNTSPSDLVPALLAVAEAVIGLGLVALLISYLPSIYSSFQRRELAVSMLEVRAGDPPSAIVLLRRHHAIGSLERLNPLFEMWEAWFADLQETHTSQSSLCFFRSPLPGRSWVTAAGAVLDSAALVLSSVDVPSAPEPALCLRAGFLSLRQIADFFAIPYDADPVPGNPIAIARSEFDDAYNELAEVGIPMRPDRDQCWRDFAGWRVNYDEVLIGLAGLTMAPYAPWSSDRSVRHPVPKRTWERLHRGKHKSFG